MREQLPWTDKSLGLHPSSDAGVMTLIGHNNDTSVPLPSDQESVRTHPFPLCQSGAESRPPYNIKLKKSTPFGLELKQLRTQIFSMITLYII